MSGKIKYPMKGAKTPPPSFTPMLRGMLQRKTQNSELGIGHDSAVPKIVHVVLRSPGQPLDPATRAFMEPRFGHEFSGVRLQFPSPNGFGGLKVSRASDPAQ